MTDKHKTLQDLKIAEKVAQDAYDEAKKQDDDAKAALDLATQQDADEEKKRDAGFIPFEISGAGLVSKCRIPTTAVAQLGVFRILLGSESASDLSLVEDIQQKYGQTAAALYAKAAGQNAQARQLYNASADTYYMVNDAAAYDDWVRARNHWDYFYNRS